MHWNREVGFKECLRQGFIYMHLSEIILVTKVQLAKPSSAASIKLQQDRYRSAL
jgi:hypothetical protein